MLQGSLENFTIPEILGLLANTTKTGRLKVSGDRGTGSVWCRDGLLELAEASKLGDDAGIDDVMLELLRYGSGNFSFQVDEAVPAGAEVDSAEVDAVLAGATARLEEWHEIEAVVPSLEHALTPVAELSGAEVTIKADEWEFLVAVGDSRTVGEVAGRLGLGEIDVSRRAKGLIERSLVDIGSNPGRRSVDQAPADVAPVLETAPVVEPSPNPEPAAAPVGAETVEPAPFEAAPLGTESFEAESFEAAPFEAETFEADSVDADPFASPAPAPSNAGSEADDGGHAPVIEDVLASIAVNQSVENRRSSDAKTSTPAPVESRSPSADAAFAIDSGLAPSFDEPANIGGSASSAADAGVEYTDFARSAIGETGPETESTDTLASSGTPSLAADMGEIASLRETMLTDDGDEEDSSVLMQFLNNDR